MKPEFWHPLWKYNQVEVDDLRGALIYKGWMEAQSEEELQMAAVFKSMRKKGHPLCSMPQKNTWFTGKHWSLHVHLSLLHSAFPILVQRKEKS